MSYLKFDKNLMINLEQSLPREMLRTNKSGAYHCTSIVGCNTRKQHGLLVIPISDMDDQAHVLLSSLDETVIQHDAPFNLGLHQYGDAVFSPNGHKYIREFNCDTVPTVTYRVGGVILTKEKVFISHENRILIKYTLVDAHSATKIQFRPFLAFRNANDICIENENINTDIRHIDNGISVCLYPGYPDLYMQFNHKARWIDDAHWYKGIEYYKDRDRGTAYKEDLWVPGYFELPVRKGESIIFSASTSPEEPETFAATYSHELTTRTSRSSFYNCLKNSAMQFYLKKKSGMYITAGYPWYKVRARDELIALPGCTLSIKRVKEYEEAMDTFLNALHKYLDTGNTGHDIQGIDRPDIPLWTGWTIQQYMRSEGTEKCIAKYGESVRMLVEAIRNNRVPNLRLDDNGLVFTEGRERAVSWMSASIDGRPIIPRTGYLVEFNALWYNLLCVARQLSEDVLPDYSAELTPLIDNSKESFIQTFLNNHNYLYDYVAGAYADLSVRPNMAIAIGLDYSPLDRGQRKRVLDYVTRELLTPKGLRSLSPNSYGYRPFYVGNPREREYAIHQGPARPWLFGFYADAYFKVFGLSGLSFIERMLIGYDEEMSEGCIGSLSEMYDGNPPYSGHGAVSTAKNVGEILRTLKNVKEMAQLQVSQNSVER